MAETGPRQSLDALFAAFNAGKVDVVLAMYEEGAAMVAQPGQVANGIKGVREVVGGFLALKPTLTLEKNEIVTAGDIALSVTKWTLEGTDPGGQPVHLEGTATDVLRRQADGRWRFVIDNPYGAGILR